MTTTTNGSSSATPPRRVRVAQALALLALVAALIGAVGPAERVRTTYSWPPETLPAETPSRAWYTPLLLIWHHPDQIAADIPCTLPAALPEAEEPATVLATAHRPERIGGLAVQRSGDELIVKIGDEVLQRIELSSTAANGRDCAYRVRVGSEQWTVDGGPRGLETGGMLERRPVVSGLFSNLDLRSRDAPSVAVTTAVHATRTTMAQAVAWTFAAVGALTALLLVSFGRRPRRPWFVALDLLRRARSQAHPVDVVVGLLLVGWWVISPAFFDDGWVTARERMFSSSRGFPHYYSTLGVNVPLDYWLEWVHHWIAQSTLSLLWNRLPALFCLVVIWALCRFIASRVFGATAGRSAMPLWTLASVFVIGAVAWGMTVRPEPVTALFVTAVMACMVLYLQRESTAAIALAAALVPLAMSAHPAGIVSLAAIVAAAPRLVRWVRPNAAVATAIVAASIALLATLLFVGADLEQRRTDAQLTRTYGSSEYWHDELTRYRLLVQHHYGTPLRRMTVVLIALPALAFLFRRRRTPRTLLDYPASVAIAGLVLLIATPSKWPSHFGTLLGVAAVAFCCEAARVRGEASRSEGWRAWPFIAIGAASLAVGWAWLIREKWNVVDLRTLDWRPGFESVFPIARLAALLPILVLAGALVIGYRRRRGGLDGIPWRVASWSAPLMVVPVLAFSAVMLVADAAKTGSWTLTRQNVGTLVGRDPGCGLADAMSVPVADSMRPIAAVTGQEPSPVADWVPAAPVGGLARHTLGPSARESASTTWFRIPAAREFGIFVTGAPRQSDRLLLEWGREEGDTVLPLGRDGFDAYVGPLTGNAGWRFFAAGDLPEARSRATAVRVVHDVGISPGGAVAVSSPVTYRNEDLSTRMTRPDAQTLVLPNLLMYFPCTRLPLLHDGIVDPPHHIVSWENQFSPFRYQVTSPFIHVLDLFELQRLPAADSETPPAEVLAYDVDQRIPGAVLAPATALTSTS